LVPEGTLVARPGREKPFMQGWVTGGVGGKKPSDRILTKLSASHKVKKKKPKRERKGGSSKKKKRASTRNTKRKNARIRKGKGKED